MGLYGELWGYIIYLANLGTSPMQLLSECTSVEIVLNGYNTEILWLFVLEMMTVGIIIPHAPPWMLGIWERAVIEITNSNPTGWPRTTWLVPASEKSF